MSEPLEFQGAAQETAIRKLLLDANRPEALGLSIDALEAMPPEAEARLRLLLRNPFGYAKKKAWPIWRRVLHTAACVAVALTLALGSLLAVSPNARAVAVNIWNIFVEWTRQSTSFYFTGVRAAPIGVWRLDELPEGFVEVRKSIATGAVMTRYENEAGDRLIFTYLPVQEGYMFDMDNEHSMHYEPEINGQTAYLFDSDTEGKMSTLIWFSKNGEVGFKITGDFSGADLLKMAQTLVAE